MKISILLSLKSKPVCARKNLDIDLKSTAHIVSNLHVCLHDEFSLWIGGFSHTILFPFPPLIHTSFIPL